MTPTALHVHDSGTTPARIAAVAARQKGQIHARQLQAIGLAQSTVRARVRARRLFESYPRVYRLGPDITDDGWRMAALLAVPGWGALNHWSAAELYRIGDRPGYQHHVVTTTRKRDVGDALKVHRTRTVIRTRTVRGLRVVEPGRVLIDLAVDLSGRPLERVVGQARFRRLIGDDGVEQVLARYPGHPGAANLAPISAKDALRRRTETTLEEDVLVVLDTLPVGLFVCQCKLRGLSGKQYRADFAWERERMILEADGRTAHQRLEAIDDDRARDADLLAAGWRTLRVTGYQLRAERSAFVSSLLGALARGV